MSLLNVPFRPFPPIFSSPTCSLTRPSASSAPLTGIRRPACATPLVVWSVWPSGQSDHRQVESPSSASMSVTSTRRSTSPAATGISRTITTQLSPQLRILIHLDTPELQAAAMHTAAASRVPAISKLVSLRNSFTKVLADFDSVDSRNGIMKTCADLDRETVVSTLFYAVFR